MLLFVCGNAWDARSLLSLKRATQRLDVTRPYAARHWGFSPYWRAFAVDFGNLGGHGHGYGSLRIHRYASRKSGMCAAVAMRSFLTLVTKAMCVGRHWRTARERQQTPCQWQTRYDSTDGTAASSGTDCRTRSPVDLFLLNGCIRRSTGWCGHKQPLKHRPWAIQFHLQACGHQTSAKSPALNDPCTRQGRSAGAGGR